MAKFQENLAPVNSDQPSADAFTVYIETYGCQMNVYDSQAIGGLLNQKGFQGVQTEPDADIVLINTCSVRDHAEHRVISRVGELRRKRELAELPQPIIGICGCMAERMGQDLRKSPNRVDLVVGVDNYDELPGLLAGFMADQPPRTRTVIGHRQDAHYVAPPELYPTNNSHLVTIHKGCDYKCTYCIVPYTRGPQTEKDPQDILTEIQKIAASGGREITLLGQNVTAYNWQEQMDFSALLELVAEQGNIDRIRFLTGHPRDMHPHLMDTIGQLKQVCPWLHLPIQSGNDRVLRRMNRRYTRQDYMDMVDYARKVIPDVTFSTDFIVGFPGETDEQFQDTLEVVRQVKYDLVFAFKYSERPGVPAAKLGDDVTEQQKKDRLAALLALQEEIWNAGAKGKVGQVWQGVIDADARRPAGAWRMRTANNRKVILEGGDLAIGQEVTAKITGYRNTTFLGERLD